MRWFSCFAWIATFILLPVSLDKAAGQETRRLILPEQRHLEIRDPASLARYRIPTGPPPQTVSDVLGGGANSSGQKGSAAPAADTWQLSLDEAIRIALGNAEAIRVIAGLTTSGAGPTIYEPAIANTQIDEARGRFDPTLRSNNTFSKTEQPFGTFINPGQPGQVGIDATPVDGFQSSTGVSKQFATGGTLSLDANSTRTFTRNTPPLPLNPQTANNVTMGLDQPLLKGAGAAANLAPIVIARINTERSFFQMKDAVQEMVLNVALTYWNLSAAQTDAWARRQQVQQGREAYERAQARLEAGLGDEGEVAQSRVSYENFNAALVAAEATVLDQEDLLRNLLGLPVFDPRRIVLQTSPQTEPLPLDWQQILNLAEQYRPDVIELKLVLEADQQEHLLARNQALPQLNLAGLYRWNGLDGITPDRQELSSRGGQFTDWQMGVNFSVPLGLRSERAAIRQRELILVRDRVHLEQALHSAAHGLAGNLRNVSRYQEQFQRYRRVRQAAEINLQRQLADYTAGRRTLYLNVLLAITDWGNAVTAEYQALIQYNNELARLERQTGTILETHGVRFVEERFAALGPLGRAFPPACYPRDLAPGPNVDQPPPPGEPYRLPEAPKIPEIDASAPLPPEPVPAPRAMPAPTR